MNHMRNIKEMLSITTGSSRNGATSGYSSFTDSQIFFGSQFWPENSQGTSQDMSLSSRASQQSSQEGSEPKFTNSYHTKPLLFGEIKDKSKTFGILDKFEEDKKRLKERNESDIVAKEYHHFRETLNNIHQLVAGTEKNTAVCHTVFEKFDDFTSSVQNNLNSLQSEIAQQFVTLLNKVTAQKETMTELEERVQKSGDSTAELGLGIQVLRNGLEGLREDHDRERIMLEEALKLLSNLVSKQSANPSSERLMDSAIQTSPWLEKSLLNVLQDNKLEGTQLTHVSKDLEHNEVPLQGPRCVIGNRKLARKGHRRCKKRPLVLSQRSKRAVTDENGQHLMNCNKQQNVSSPLCERRDYNTVTSRDSPSPDRPIPPKRETRSVAAGRFITPLSCWSQDSDVEPILEKPTAESNTENPMKPEGFWQLFDMNSDFDF